LIIMNCPELFGETEATLWKEFEAETEALSPLLKYEIDKLDSRVGRAMWETVNGFVSFRRTEPQTVGLPILAYQLGISEYDETSGTKKTTYFFAERWAGKDWEIRKEENVDEIGRSSALEATLEEITTADEFIEDMGLNRGDVFDLRALVVEIKKLPFLPRIED